MAISDEEVYLLNNSMGGVAHRCQLGTKIKEAEAGSGGLNPGDVGTTELADGAVTSAKMASALQPSHVVKFAGKHTTAGGAALEEISVGNVLATDIVMVSLEAVGETPRTIVAANPDADKINVTFDDDPGSDHVVSYVVFRAV